MSNKLFDSSLLLNNFQILKSSLNSNYQVSINTCTGKARIGKSTLINNFINIIEENTGEKKYYFKEEGSNIGVTRGVDYYIYTDNKNKKHYVFLDCEGAGYTNDNEMEKLYLIVSSISDVLVFNVEKSFDDQLFKTYINKIIVNLELHKLQVPKIHILLRDVSRDSINNLLLSECTQDNAKNLIKAKEIIAKKINSKYILPESIHLITPPMTNNEGEFITYNKDSLYFKDTVNYVNYLKSNINFNTNLDNAEKRLNYIWNVKSDEFSENRYTTYMKESILNIFNKTKGLIFNNASSFNSKSTCQVAIAKKKQELFNVVKEQYQKLFLVVDDIALAYINEINNKFCNQKIANMETAYSDQQRNYLTLRENTKTKPTYHCVEESYLEDYKDHAGTLQSLCTGCLNNYSSGGCQTNQSHQGTIIHTSRTDRFLGIKIRRRNYYNWSCCGRSQEETTCPTVRYLHPGCASLYSCCKKDANSVPCRTTKVSKQRYVTRQNPYVFDYTMANWSEGNFRFSI